MKKLAPVFVAMVAIACMADTVPLRKVGLGTMVYVENMTNSMSSIAFSSTYSLATNALLGPVYSEMAEDRMYNSTNYISQRYWNDVLGPTISGYISERATTNQLNDLRDLLYGTITNLVTSGLEIDGHTYRLVEVGASEEPEEEPEEEEPEVPSEESEEEPSDDTDEEPVAESAYSGIVVVPEQ